MPRIAIHGFGRIGRSLMKIALRDHLAETAAHLAKEAVMSAA